MAIIITDECINCGACEPECPNTAIYEGFIINHSGLRIRSKRVGVEVSLKPVFPSSTCRDCIRLKLLLYCIVFLYCLSL